ncbi:uncharacterized protein LOC133790602 isoform X2 [Humulus lupulus]|uniref:uncharacterized protein LOC133790602 isoform X2 n=1 Tax=Humulus lupulus TaxID=3486 RepID=UPI002B403496|nr:uncharacterized protein LOC133790602 isoform X2 [Humulus lupulus]
MAYVPPHKRLSKKDDGQGSSRSPLPKPELPPFLIKYRNPKHKPSSSTTAHYQDTSFEDTFRWFAAGLDDHHHFPPSVHLQPVAVESNGDILKRLALFNIIDSAEEKSSNAVTESFTRRPWECIAENVLPDLLSCFEKFRSRTEPDQDDEKVTPMIIARFGKVLFRGRCSDYEQKSVTRISLSEKALRPLRGSFYTDILDSYVEYLEKEGASKSGLEFEQEKEVFRVVFRDASQPNVNMWCKCRVLEDGKFDIYKIEHVYTRHMLRDISCLEKNLDMRLDLSTKRTVTTFTDDDLESLKILINSAVTKVKDELICSWGSSFFGKKFRVVASCLISSKTYKNQTLRLKIKDVDRSPSGEATREVVVMLKGVASELMNDLKVIWDNILCCERFPEDINGRSKWFPVGLDDRDQFPPSVHLQPFSLQSPQQKYVYLKPLALINTDLPEQSCSRVKESFTMRPWEYIAENVLQELLSYFEDWRSEMESEDIKSMATVMVVFGKVLFFRPSISQESVAKKLLTVDELKSLKKSFHSDIPNSYVEYITREGASKSGLEFEKEKEVYHVYFGDSREPDDFFCKCRVLKEDKKLQMYKIRPCNRGYMLNLISCLETNLDMILDVVTKETKTDLTDDDMKIVRDLIDSAIVDSNVQGGLRWPLGKTVFGDKFCVGLVLHTTRKVYKNSSLKLNINDIDLYDFESSKGQARRDVAMCLKGLSSELLKQEVDASVISEMLKNELRVLWDNFLCCNHMLVRTPLLLPF